jgi:prepilin-type N-terminal cleavage/methylation domain-containing protein
MRRAGFTLAELLVSLAVLGIVSIYLTNMLTQQNRAYTVVDQVTETQGNARAILDMLERDVRGTGMAAAEAGIVCGVDNTNDPDVLFVTDSSVFKYDRDKNPARFDQGAEVQGIGFVASGSNTIISLNTLAADGIPYHDLDADGTTDSDFRPGGSVIVAERYRADRGVACGVIVAGGVDVGNKTVTVNFDAGAENLSIGSAAEVFPAKRYTVNGDQELVRDGVVLAGDVEDLQVSFFFDRPPFNGESDGAALEEPGTFDGNVYEVTDWDNTQLREVRLGIVVRSRRPDPNLPGAIPQALENRQPVAVADGFRRRVLQAVMRPRNVGHRLDGDIF